MSQLVYAAPHRPVFEHFPVRRDVSRLHLSEHAARRDQSKIYN
jgi:hypothetical protein